MSGAFTRINHRAVDSRQALGPWRRRPRNQFGRLALFHDFFRHDQRPSISRMRTASAVPGRQLSSKRFGRTVSAEQSCWRRLAISDLQLFTQSVPEKHNFQGAEDVPLSVFDPDLHDQRLKTAFQIGFLVVSASLPGHPIWSSPSC